MRLLLIVLLVASITGMGQIPEFTPDGTKLVTGDFCYTMTAKVNGIEKPTGYTFQSIKRQQVNGVDALAIVVHQHLSNGKFDMRDSFLLHRANLRPIILDTERNGTPHVHLDYAGNHVAGWKMVEGKKQPINLNFDHPVWDGNLWGVTFASLPLQTGGSYQLPIYQYDSGAGNFIVKVVGTRTIDALQGSNEAWVLQAGIREGELVEYTVARHGQIELGYAAGPSSQHLGGDCSGLH